MISRHRLGDPHTHTHFLPTNVTHLCSLAFTVPSVAPSGLSGGGGAPGELTINWTVSGRGQRSRQVSYLSGVMPLFPPVIVCLQTQWQQQKGLLKSYLEAGRFLPHFPCISHESFEAQASQGHSSE